MATFIYEQDGEVRKASRSFFRGDTTNFHPTNRSLQSDDVVEKYIFHGLGPSAPFVTQETPIVAFGSCFAGNISRYLSKRGFNVLTARDNAAYVTKMGDGIVNTFALRQQFEWAWEGKTPRADLWHGFRAEEFGYDEAVREVTKKLFDEAELFILTLGLSEVWYDSETGEVFWRAVPADRYDPTRHKFRVSTHAENLENLQAIHRLIRKYRPEAHIVFSLSPIPLAATFRDTPCVVADAASKAILRSALDEFLRAAGDNRTFYFPSYEVVTRFFRNQWDSDRRHVNGNVLDFNMELFERYFCTTGVSAETLLASFKACLRDDEERGREPSPWAGLSFTERQELKRAQRRQERIDARVAARQAERQQAREETRRSKVTKWKVTAAAVGSILTIALPILYDLDVLAW